MDSNDKILQIFDNLSKQERLDLEAHVLGYIKLPPTIREFLNSNYYLGQTYGDKLYSYWLPVLEDIFPDEIHTNYDTIVLTGCIGSGKTTISTIIAQYTRCRLDHMKNMDFFELAKGKNFVFSFFHTVAQTVQDAFLDPLKVIRERSPYFTSGMLNNPIIDELADTPRGKGPIGLDVILYVFSEVNFIKPEIARAKLNTAFNRLSARFEKAKGYFGTIVIDSSAAESGSFVDEFIEERCDPATTKIVRPKIWEIKPHIYGNEGWFEVYLGDSARDAYIMNKDQDDDTRREGLDPDRILLVPKELYVQFSLDINLSLNDHAGISTSSNDYFIMDRKALSKAFSLPMKNQEVIEIDFYDHEKIMDRLYDSVKDIPKDKILSLRFDIGVVSDYTGLSICYFDGWDVKSEVVKGHAKDVKTRVPRFKNIVTAAIGRISGQETSITKLYQFAKDLSVDYEIGAITADQFQSRQLLQDLRRDGFNAYEISVDRTDAPYQQLKLAIYEGRIEMPQSLLLQRELRELQYSRKNGKGKVDHPETTNADSLTFGKGSKDCFVGDTKVLVVDKRDYIFSSISLEDLINVKERYHIISYDESSKIFKVSELSDIFISGKASDLVEVEMEDGYIFRCTGDHLLLTQEGYKKSEDLTLNDIIINLK